MCVNRGNDAGEERSEKGNLNCVFTSRVLLAVDGLELTQFGFLPELIWTVKVVALEYLVETLCGNFCATETRKLFISNGS